jgi:transcriptional regulator with XRE-family HTH domain
VLVAERLAREIGIELHDERQRRHWSLRELASRAGLSPAAVQHIETGGHGSIESYARLGVALALKLEFRGIDPRRRAAGTSDTVHSLMGEVEAAHLRQFGPRILIDEPYQHYQFAGRADLVAVLPHERALLHIENRTRFPNLQEAAGSYNAKRAYLAGSLAERFHVRGGFRSVCHVMAGLWSSEVQHAVRMRVETFDALCPDPSDAFAAWWQGNPPPDGATSTFVLLDPFAAGRSRTWVGIPAGLGTRPRFRGYAEAADGVQMSNRR